jgi:hypothetical protein
LLEMYRMGWWNFCSLLCLNLFIQAPRMGKLEHGTAVQGTVNAHIKDIKTAN